MRRIPYAHARRLAICAAAFALAACSAMPSATSPSAATLSATQVAAVVDSPDRSAADRTNDQRRHPAQMLAFIGIRPGMTALDVSAGGGYTTELLARAIGPAGVVYSQRPPPREPDAMAPAAPGPIVERAERLRAAGVAAARIVPVVQPFTNPVPADAAGARLDLVTLMFNYHDFSQVDRAAMNRAIFAALKPGGVYVLADHSGRPGTGISESRTLHRIEEAFLRREVEQAGFRLAEEGSFLRNPADPRDRNTPEPPQPKDEFVLKFVKP